jgi:hypothetical protein
MEITPLRPPQTNNNRSVERTLLKINFPRSILVTLTAQHPAEAVITKSALLSGCPTEDRYLLA